jgi:hypothetical protein
VILKYSEWHRHICGSQNNLAFGGIAAISYRARLLRNAVWRTRLFDVGVHYSGNWQCKKLLPRCLVNGIRRCMVLCRDGRPGRWRCLSAELSRKGEFRSKGHCILHDANGMRRDEHRG